MGWTEFTFQFRGIVLQPSRVKKKDYPHIFFYFKKLYDLLKTLYD